MEWWQLVFVLIVIAGYVVKHIISAQQEQQSRPGVESAPKRVLETQSDEEVASERTALDRRIEEAIERRREGEETPMSSRLPKRSIPMPSPTVVKPVPRYRPAAIVPAPPPRRPAPVKPAIPDVPPAPPSSAPKETRPIVMGVAATVKAPPVSPAVRQVLELLKDRQTLGAAVVLREILDRPVSLRRRRG